jgi:hypothetical protein
VVRHQPFVSRAFPARGNSSYLCLLSVSMSLLPRTLIPSDPSSTCHNSPFFRWLRTKQKPPSDCSDGYWRTGRCVQNQEMRIFATGEMRGRIGKLPFAAGMENVGKKIVYRLILWATKNKATRIDKRVVIKAIKFRLVKSKSQNLLRHRIGRARVQCRTSSMPQSKAPKYLTNST